MMEIGSFFLGTDPEFALITFDDLSGDDHVTEDTIIRIDLIKKEDNFLPITLKCLGCTLSQYAENCKTIARNLFKYFALEK